MISDKTKYLKKLIELDFSFLFSSSTLNNNNNNNNRRVIHRFKPLILLTFFKIEYQPVANRIPASCKKIEYQPVAIGYQPVAIEYQLVAIEYQPVANTYKNT